MKRYFKLIVIGIVFIILIALLFFIKVEKKEEVVEYIPEEEITDEESRKTIVSLYFFNKETKNLEIEARLIDSKTLLKNPYEELVNLLMEGPKDEKLERAISIESKLYSANLKDGIVVLDFSKEFFVQMIEETEENMNCINSIVNTLTELKEVNGVQFISQDGEDEIKNSKINFGEIFTRT